ncbi:MAG: phosphoribosylaminoimidazolesuccinocarboxamide synthase [Nitrososphaerales archaeon]
MLLIKKGKVKDIYEYDKDKLLFVFSDRVSAFDVILPNEIPHKGEVLCKFAKFWFEALDITHHMIGLKDDKSMIVKKLKMIPIEFVVRGYLYGSLYERLIKGEVRLDIEPILASKLPKPLFDPTTKSDVKDLPINKQEIIDRNLLRKDEIDFLEKRSLELYERMYKIADKAGFIIADVKFEFGLDDRGEIVLADSLGPDEFRLWLKEDYKPNKIQESYDKQLIRDWLIDYGYKAKLDEARKNNREIPKPPKLPSDLVKKVSERYIFSYEKITGKKFLE